MNRHETAEALLRDLLAWRRGQDLRPLLERTIKLCGSQVTENLPKGLMRARERLIDIVEEYFERKQR